MLLDDAAPHVIVCGGRFYEDVRKVHRVLAAHWAHFPPGTIMVEGGNRRRRPDGTIDWNMSADALAYQWAIQKKIPVKTEYVTPDEWERWKTRYGNAAGNKRNTRMLDIYHPFGVIAFPGGSGTLDMVTQARSRNLHIFLV